MAIMVRFRRRRPSTISKYSKFSSQLANFDQILYKASSGWDKAAKGFWADWIGTLVARATYSSHRLIMAKH